MIKQIISTCLCIELSNKLFVLVLQLFDCINLMEHCQGHTIKSLNQYSYCSTVLENCRGASVKLKFFFEMDKTFFNCPFNNKTSSIENISSDSRSITATLKLIDKEMSEIRYQPLCKTKVINKQLIKIRILIYRLEKILRFYFKNCSNH